MISYNQVGQGTFLRIYEFARELVKRGQQVTIMATSKNKRFGIKNWEENGIKIVTFPSLFKSGPRFGWDPYSIILRIKWVNSKNFDLVHGFESRPTVIYPALWLMNKGVPLVLDWCDWFGKGGSVEERPNQIFKLFFRPFETFYENHFRRKPDFTTVICKTLYQRAIDLGVKSEKISLIRNGLNMPGWKNFSKGNAREQFGYQSGDFVIGYIGSLFPKDARLMSDAFSLLNQNLSKIKLLHLGRSNYFSKNNNPNISITGNISLHNLQMGLAACDICWLPFSDIPANWGRFPLKFSNYLSAGKPVIATNVGDIPSFINLFDLGLVCEPNAVALSDAVRKIAADPVVLKYYSDNSLNLSHNTEHSWEHYSSILLSNYFQITQ